MNIPVWKKQGAMSAYCMKVYQSLASSVISKTKDIWVLVQITMQTDQEEQIAVSNLLSFDLLLLQVPDNPPNYILFLNNLPEETNEMMLSMLFNQ